MPPLLALAYLQERLSRLNDRILGSIQMTLERINSRVEDLTLSELDALKNAAEASQNSYAWRILREIGSLVLAVFSLIGGAFMIFSAGATAGGSLMVASAFIALANASLSAFGGWDWIAEILSDDAESRKTLMLILPLILSIISIALNAGAVYEIQKHVMMETKNIMQVLGTLTAYLQSGLSISQAHSEYVKGKAEDRLMDCEQNLEFSTSAAKDIQRTLERLMEVYSNNTSLIKRGFDTSLQRGVLS
jgi:hypothetical protein